MAVLLIVDIVPHSSASTIRSLMSEPTSPATTPQQAAPTRLPARALLLLIMVVILWGGSYPTMKAAALEMPIIFFRGWAAFLPAVVMLTIARAIGHSLRVPRQCWMGVAISGFCTVTLTHTLTNVSTLYMASGQTSLMLYTMPIWAAIISIPVLGERPTRLHWLGVALGFGGIVLLWSQTAQDGVSFGVLIGVVSAIAWACGTIAVKSVSRHLPALVLTGWSFAIGALPLCFYGFTEIDQLGPVSDRALWSALYIMFGANFLGFLTFFYIIGMVPAVVASLSVVAVPGVAFVLGVFILDEIMTAMDGVAFALIAGALATVLPKPSIKRNASGKERHEV